MVRAIREYAQQTGMAVGFKPAGGIRTAKQSMDWLALMKEELDNSWMRRKCFVWSKRYVVISSGNWSIT